MRYTQIALHLDPNLHLVEMLSLAQLCDWLHLCLNRCFSVLRSSFCFAFKKGFLILNLFQEFLTALQTYICTFEIYTQMYIFVCVPLYNVMWDLRVHIWDYNKTPFDCQNPRLLCNNRSKRFMNKCQINWHSLWIYCYSINYDIVKRHKGILSLE